MPILDHFSWLARHYERVASPPDPQEWKQRLALPVSGALLDAGGGTGRISAPLRPWVHQVVLADPAWGMVCKAVEKPELRVVHSEAERLPFPDGYFARILMVDALHHVRDQVQTARELFRVLSPGGLLVIEEPDIRHFSIKLVAIGEKLLLMRSKILAPTAIVRLFDGLPASTHLESDGSSIVIKIEKPA